MNFLLLAGLLNFAASALHIAMILGGPTWYRFFGAGEAMAQMAEQNLLKPTVITASIALILAGWGTCAWSGAGLLPQFPYLKATLIGITVVYIVRGFAGLLAPFVSTHPLVLQNSPSFWLWSSAICIGYGMVHLKGVVDNWPQL